MKKIFFTLLAITISSIIIYSCSNDEQVNVSKQNALSLIKSDLEQKKYYPNVKNKYDYSSVNLRKFLNKNTALVNNKNSTHNKVKPSLDECKTAVVQFYKNTEHDELKINEMFDSSLNAINTYENYDYMLADLVNKGTISSEEKLVIDYYLELFFTTNSSADLEQITSTFIYYINESDFSEFEKRGMLTIFDVMNANKMMLKNNEDYNFLQFFENSNTTNAKPSMDTICAGNVITGLLFGAATGNGIGAVIGLAGGLWADYTAGCMG